MDSLRIETKVVRVMIIIGDIVGFDVPCRRGLPIPDHLNSRILLNFHGNVQEPVSFDQV